METKPTISNPQVSVLLPNLNNCQFLAERIDTILAQTYTDWELIIVDSQSDDGAWELIQSFANRDRRIKAVQTPRDGIYAGWNQCIRLALGEYIYFATSDDTMLPQCLEKMVAAMDAHPECEICHTPLIAIDENGKEIPNWWAQTPPAKYYGDAISQLHMRLAPLDGLLHCALHTVYISVTQLLIRRSTFKKVGLYRTDLGVQADFEWSMRATLVCHTLHLPEYLATWRIHPNQATKANDPYWQYARFCQMIEAAFPILGIYNPELFHKIDRHRLLFIYRSKQLETGLLANQGRLQKLLFLLNFGFSHPQVAIDYLSRIVGGKSRRFNQFDYMRKELQSLGLDQCLQFID